MKNILFSFMVGLVLFSFNKRADACTPPRDIYEMQALETRSLFTNKEVDSTIYKLAKQTATVKSVLVEKGYVITLTNGCHFTAKPIWHNPGRNGACPIFDGFRIENEVCN